MTEMGMSSTQNKELTPSEKILLEYEEKEREWERTRKRMNTLKAYRKLPKSIPLSYFIKK